jgi:hypothetical protein
MFNDRVISEWENGNDVKGECSVIIRLQYRKQNENIKINCGIDRLVSWSRFEPVPF